MYSVHQRKTVWHNLLNTYYGGQLSVKVIKQQKFVQTIWLSFVIWRRRLLGSITYWNITQVVHIRVDRFCKKFFFNPTDEKVSEMFFFGKKLFSPKCELYFICTISYGRKY